MHLLSLIFNQLSFQVFCTEYHPALLHFSEIASTFKKIRFRPNVGMLIPISENL